MEKKEIKIDLEALDKPRFFPTERPMEGGEKEERRINTILDKGGMAFLYYKNTESERVYKIYRNVNGEDVAYFKDRNGEETLCNPQSKWLYEARCGAGEPITADEYEKF